MMGRACSVCVHSEREAIDAALVGGEPNRRIAARYGLSEAAVRRHKREHLPTSLARAKDALDVVSADDLLGQAQELLESARRILRLSEKARNYRVALAANREAAGRLELLARMLTAAWQTEQQGEGPPRVRTIVATVPSEAVLDKEIDDLVRAALVQSLDNGEEPSQELINTLGIRGWRLTKNPS